MIQDFEEIPGTVLLSRQVEERIRKAITSGRMQPNVLYTEAAIARQLGVSRTPVREAVLDLESRGFVAIFPRRGFQVRIFTEEAVREVYDLRWALESHALRTLAEHPERYDLSRLTEAAKAQKESAAKGDITNAVIFGRNFHNEMLRMNANSMISKIFDDIQDIISVMWSQAFTKSISAGDVADDHLLLIDLIRKGDVDAVCSLLREHLRRSEQAVLAAQASTAQMS